MRKQNSIIYVLICVSVWIMGCSPLSGRSALNGSWRGTITEGGKSVLVELKIFEQGDMLHGAFKILSKTRSNDFTRGMSFEIVQAERVGEHLKFIVPFSGEIDNDAVAFDLIIEGNKLTGFGKELNPRSENVPITFKKHRIW